MAKFTYSGSESFDLSRVQLGFNRQVFLEKERATTTTAREWTVRQPDGEVTVHKGKGLKYGEITKAGHTIEVPNAGEIRKIKIATDDGKPGVLKLKLDAAEFFAEVKTSSSKDDARPIDKALKGDDVMLDFRPGQDVLVIDVKRVDREDVSIDEVDGDAVIAFARTTVTLQGVSSDELSEAAVLLL